MCTVSFVPLTDKILITSNRDEKKERPIALPPQCLQHTTSTLWYPVDIVSGGTWFITNQSGDVGVLLNGAFEKHISKPPYVSSRGKILPHLFIENDILKAVNQYPFSGIENCTLILYVKNELYKCVWNGTKLTVIQLNHLEPHIWSSVTLYSQTMIQERHDWFYQFLISEPEPTQQQMIHFHTNAGNGNTEFGLKMNRNNAMLTVSITSVAITNQQLHLHYEDLLCKPASVSSILVEKEKPIK